MAAGEFSQDELGPEFVAHMRQYLRTRRLELEPCAKQLFLRTWCRTEVLVKRGSLVIACAQPIPGESWTFGDCFPQLPGAWEKASGNRGSIFHLRFLKLTDPLWVYVWSCEVKAEEVEKSLRSMQIFRDWSKNKKHSDLGLTDRDLVTLPLSVTRTTVGGRAFGGTSNPEARPRGGLFLWGDVDVEGIPIQMAIGSPSAERDLRRADRKAQAVEAFMGELSKVLGNGGGGPFVRAKVEYAEGLPHLVLQLPPNGREFGDAFTNGTVYCSAPIFYSPEGSRIGAKGDFVLSKEARIHVDLNFPLDGDLIRATGTYRGGPEHLLGGSASFGLPGSGPSFKAEKEIEVALEFSKSRKELTRLEFKLEMHEDWHIIPAPVAMVMKGVFFHVTVFNPFGPGRMVMAQIAADATFGEGDKPFELVCGGSYPSGDLFLQSKTGLEIGKLIERMVGPSEGLEKLEVDDLRIEYNYRSKAFALEMDVKTSWEIVNGLVLEDVFFRIQGGESYSGGVAARLTIGEKDKIHLKCSALYDAGWQFEASTGAEEEIPVGRLLEGLAHSFGAFDNVPGVLQKPEKGEGGAAEYKGVVLKNLHVYGNTATKDFSFKGEVDFDLENRKAVLEVSIDITHPTKDKAEKRFSGILRVGDQEFDVVFAQSHLDLKGPPERKDLAVSNLVASYHSVSGKGGLEVKDLLPSWEGPKIEMLAAFVALQRLPADPNVKDGEKDKAKRDAKGDNRWLLGIKLKAGMNLAAIKLPSLPLVSKALNLPPDVSLSLDLQAVGALPTKKPFEKAQIESIAALNATGKLTLPADDIKAVAIVALVTMNGKVVALNLPIGPKLERKERKDVPPLAVTGTAPPDVVQAGPDSQDSTKWITVQKKIGPVEVERLGLRYENERIWVLFDASLGLSGLTLSLAGLGADSSIKKFDPHFHLSGVGIDYKSPAIEIGGAFLKQTIKDPHPLPGGAAEYDAYCGQAVLRTKQFALSVIGAYAKYHGEPSLFIYGVLDKEMGGIAPFFVTGAAVGFGYNRKAVIPKVEQIHTYPLVTKAIAGPKPLGKKPEAAGPPAKNAAPATAQGGANTLMVELQALNTWLPPTTGQIFLAIGVKFNSFKLVDSFALLIAQFGDHFSFDLVGVSDLQVPGKKAGGDGTPLARILMNWTAFFHPEEGEMGLRAVLAPGSFILSPDCQLTGGFAYYTWFAGEHTGDFVVTVGGYHPKFTKPGHYPAVKRLTFNWILNKGIKLNFKGTLYYALCGHALMAGGSLDATMEGGFDIGIAGVHFRAALHIAADFLITWQPYHYDAAVSLGLVIDITARFLFYTTHFSLDVGADMHMWGPEFAGEANVHLKVCGISHTMHVTFGAGPPRLVPISWDKFQKAFLPQVKEVKPPADKNKSKTSTAAEKPKLSERPANTNDEAICGVTVKSGLIRAVKEGENTRWVVNPRELVLVTNSLIPVKSGQLGDAAAEELVPKVDGAEGKLEIPFRPSAGTHVEVLEARGDVGIASMGVEHEHFESSHKIVIRREQGDREVDSYFRCEPVLKSMPAALWAMPRFVNPKTRQYLAKPETDGERLLPNVLAGFEVHPAVRAKRGETLSVDRHELTYETERRHEQFAWNDIPAFETVDGAPEHETTEDTAERIKKAWDGIEETVLGNPTRERILQELKLSPALVLYRRRPGEHALDLPQISKGQA